MNEKLPSELIKLYAEIKRCYESGKKSIGSLEKLKIDHRALWQSFGDMMLCNIVESGDTLTDFDCSDLIEIDKTSEEYFRSAIGNAYNAYFDVCDAISICYREEITNRLKSHTSEAINTAIPNYYSSFRGKIDECNQAIHGVNEKLGEENLESKASDAETCRASLEQLRNIFEIIDGSKSALAELKEEENKSIVTTKERDKKNFRNDILVALVGTVFGVGLTELLHFLFG